MIVEVDGQRVDVPGDATPEEIDAISRQESATAKPATEPAPTKQTPIPAAKPEPSLASLVPPRAVPQGLEDAAAADAAKNALPAPTPEPQKAPGFGDYMTGFARAAQAGDHEAMADLAKRGRDALAATGAKPETISAYDNWTGKTSEASGDPGATLAQHVGDVITHPAEKIATPLAMGGKSGLTLGLEPKVSAAIHALPKWLVGQPIALTPDEYAAAVAGKNGYAERYGAIRDAIQKKYDDAREANPGAFGVGQVGVSLALPFPGAAARNASTAWKVAKPALVGAGVGGLAGFGQAKGDAGEVAKKTFEGAGLGGGIGLVAGAIPEILRGLGRGAPRAANKSLGADRSVMKKVSNPAAVGQEALDQGVTLSNPEKAVQQAEELMDKAGQRMAAVKTGTAVNAAPSVQAPPADWFKGSVATDEAGAPLLVHHGTNSSFTEFKPQGDLGVHFTPDKEVANSIAHVRASEAAKNQGTLRANGVTQGSDTPRVIDAYIRLRNPLHTEDMGNWAPSEVAEHLADKGVITNQEAARFFGDAGRSPDANRRMVSLLKSKGYDGLVYNNAYEGAGSSYAVFDPAQIHIVKPSSAAKTRVALVPYEDVYADVKNQVIDPLRDPTYGGKMDPVAGHVQDFMDENWLRTLNQQQGTKFNTVQEAIDAGLKPGAGLQDMTLDEAHRLRMGMDKVSGKPGWGANPDEVNKSNALNEARNVLASHMEDAADKIGAGPEWKAANQAYKKAADIKKIASAGVSKHAGNNAIPLRTAIMTAGAIPAAGHFLMSGHPGAAVGALSAPALSWLAERYGPAATAHMLNLAGKGASSPLLPQVAAQAPKAVLPTMTAQNAPEPHAEGGEVAASAMPGVNSWLSGVDQNPKEDFVRSQTDAKYRKARGPYAPDVAPSVRPKE